ncbi:hypothetical protein FACS1894109_09110 [Spirochaetia bacterium]|nr:hypothetical protein FACS1894109_09110 [Spirochaetia bacterium]
MPNLRNLICQKINYPNSLYYNELGWRGSKGDIFCITQKYEIVDIWIHKKLLSPASHKYLEEEGMSGG